MYRETVSKNTPERNFGPAELLSIEEIRGQFQVVFFDHVRLMQLALAAMRREDDDLSGGEEWDLRRPC